MAGLIWNAEPVGDQISQPRRDHVDGSSQIALIDQAAQLVDPRLDLRAVRVRHGLREGRAARQGDGQRRREQQQD